MGRDEHWMLAAGGDGGTGRELPAMIVRRWRWFRERGARSRRGYAATELIAICGAAAVPVAAGVGPHPAVLAALGAVVIVATAVRTTFGLHESWVDFTRVRYGIERECALYLVGAAPYEEEGAAVRLLVTRVEDLSEAHGAQWAERRFRVAASRPPAMDESRRATM